MNLILHKSLKVQKYINKTQIHELNRDFTEYFVVLGLGLKCGSWFMKRVYNFCVAVVNWKIFNKCAIYSLGMEENETTGLGYESPNINRESGFP